MWEIFKNDLQKQRALKIVSAFYCDPSVAVRPATDAERAKRIFHTHRDMREILVVLDGECEYMIGNKIYQGGADTAIFVPPEISHEAHYPKGVPQGRHLWILLMPNYMQFSLFMVSGDRLRFDLNIAGFHCFSPHNQQQLVSAWDQAELDGGEPESLVKLSLLVNLQMVRLIPLYQEALRDEAHGPGKHNNMLVDNAKEYIELQCGRDCGIDLLAKRCGCSRTHFTRIFRQYAGCSVLEYINRQRVKRYLSIHNKAPVKILARELGFSSASAFIHWRKQNIDPELYVNYPMLTKLEQPGATLRKKTSPSSRR